MFSSSGLASGPDPQSRQVNLGVLAFSFAMGTHSCGA
jgi:hypothetical protein